MADCAFRSDNRAQWSLHHGKGATGLRAGAFAKTAASFGYVVLDAIRTDKGELVGYAKITRDVTAKKEAERALFECEQRFRMLVLRHNWINR